jgi:hypothetical protein
VITIGNRENPGFYETLEVAMVKIVSCGGIDLPDDAFGWQPMEPALDPRTLTAEASGQSQQVERKLQRLDDKLAQLQAKLRVKARKAY